MQMGCQRLATVSNVSVKTDNNKAQTALLQDNTGRLVPECRHSRFYWSKDDGGGEWQCYFHSEKNFYFNYNSIFPNNFISVSNFHFTENSYFNSNNILWLQFLFQFIIPSQATISTILIPIQFVRHVETQVTYTTLEYMKVSQCHCHSSSAHISIQLQECTHF